MKKAKILLSAAGILSVIAGAFAFKAQHRFSGRFYCTTIYGSTASFLQKYTTSAVGTTIFCATSYNAPKTLTTTVTVNL